MQRRGFSLPEVIIASAILLSVMAAILQSLVSAKSYEATAAALDDLAADSERSLRAIAEDLTLSGWHIPDGTTSTPPSPDVPETALETSGSDAGRLSGDLGIDRTRRYFPYVAGSGSGTSVGGDTVTRTNATHFPHAALHADVVLDPTVHPAPLATQLAALRAPTADIDGISGATTAATWYRSFTQPSQSLIFLRVFTYDGINEFDLSLPEATRRSLYGAYLGSRGPVLQFGSSNDSDLATWKGAGNHAALQVRYASAVYEASPGEWTLRDGIDGAKAYGVSLESGFVVTANDGTLRLQPQWETIDPPTYQKPTSEDEWREYIYTVVRPAYSTSLGRLVRASKIVLGTPAPPVGVELGQRISAGGGADAEAFVIDRILSDNVVRITFDTYRTDRMSATDQGRLGVNQISVRIYLAREDRVQHTILTKVAAATFTMQAKSTEAQRLEDLALLGPNRPGFPR